AYEGKPALLFTENETNTERLFGTRNPTQFVKDGINEYVLVGNRAAVNPENEGTKAALQYHTTILAGGSISLRFRLMAHGEVPRESEHAPFRDFDEIFA